MALSLADLLERFDGRPIPHCPGRYVLRAADRHEGPASMVGPSVSVSEHRVARARDRVVVAWVGEWGLISYARDDGSWLHTANTPEGFRRKLADLGIAWGQLAEDRLG